MDQIWLTHTCLTVYKLGICLCDDSMGFDKGFLSTCNLNIYDFVIGTNFIDNLRLLLITKPKEFHTYSVKQPIPLLSDPAFKSEYKTVLFVHGFTNGTARDLTQSIVAAYSKLGGYNIILLDTNTYAWRNYFRAARAAFYIGERLGQSLYIMSRRGLNISNFTLIGHSLGAHIVGFAGKAFKKKVGRKFPFIVALDPAGPCYRNVPKNQRIASSDAEFVEVIHTNGGGLGLMNAVGHVDFYFNGGRYQMPYRGETCRGICSHMRAVSLWAAAVENDHKFLGLKCHNLLELDSGYCFGGERNTVYLGSSIPKNTRGVYIVRFARVFRQCMNFNPLYYTQTTDWFGFNYGFF